MAAHAIPIAKLTPMEPNNIANTDVSASDETQLFDTFHIPSKIHSSGNNISVGTFRIADFCLIIGQEKYPVVNANTAELSGNFEIRPFVLRVNKLHTKLESLEVCTLLDGETGSNEPNIITTKQQISRPPK